MGIIVLAIAIFTLLGKEGCSFFCSGGSWDQLGNKLHPRITGLQANDLWLIYFSYTVGWKPIY